MNQNTSNSITETCNKLRFHATSYFTFSSGQMEFRTFSCIVSPEENYEFFQNLTKTFGA